MEAPSNIKDNFPIFENNKVSTKTIIANTNLVFNIDLLFQKLPVIDCLYIPKKRGRKKKNQPNVIPTNIKNGSIITLKKENLIRGIEQKKSKPNKKRSKTYFRNSLTVVMVIDEKKINFKISKNGKFQITGCKTDKQAEDCVKMIWDIIKDDKVNQFFVFKDSNTKLEVLFAPAMRNIDFNLGFFIDREKLSRYINKNTKYYSMLEASFGYTGVNIKFPMKEDITKLMIKKITQDTNSKNEWLTDEVPYSEYLDTFETKERDKKINKKRYTTFLLFHSGRAIQSGIHENLMREPYNIFINIIKEVKEEIEEKLDEVLK